MDIPSLELFFLYLHYYQILTFLTKCIRCSGTDKLTGHHVTYNPETIVTLCLICHSKITFINTVGAYATGIKLKEDEEQSNLLRTKLFMWFLICKKVTKYLVAKELGEEFMSVMKQQIIFPKLARRKRNGW